ncbi:glycosyltransferase family 2 protein [Egibacter rhizosphaerae]|uniref:Glycosyltransferase family 2 protein n=1 Tax=Egibacter rhizosphaerae TaxID=1670831 RepID=A0A411YGE5_9ACTN|nr:glycosyltransferase family 2 protein [Egibacter rhizosphaerae]QBI20310.1 glycosyltransferase family 2 protein [Egibacter rhizosphaerae]
MTAVLAPSAADLDPGTVRLDPPDTRPAPVSDRLAAPTLSRPSLVALVPAHNEAEGITSSIAALQPQVDRLVVVADNCTDDTERLAVAQGAEVFATVGNTAKKAGALNQALRLRFRRTAERRRQEERVAPERVAVERRVRDRRAASSATSDACDYVLVQDADSLLDPWWVELARRTMEEDPGLGGVGGVFRGSDDPGFVCMLQRNEYARYARDVARLKGRALVLTGTASMFSRKVLNEVVDGRERGVLPYGSGEVYDTKVLTEDNELSLAIMHLGYRIKSPKDCTLVTEVMPTWRELYGQRLRWKRGAIENLVDYGMTRVTFRYWLRQVVTLLGITVTALYLGAIVWVLVMEGSLTLYPIWLAVTGIFIAERVITVRARGPQQMLLASVLLVEMVFDVFLQGVHLRAYVDSLLRTEKRW